VLPAASKANRHGLITGATGTGQDHHAADAWPRALAAWACRCFMADVKGDLTGLSQPGALGEEPAKVLAERGLHYTWHSALSTSTLWDVFRPTGPPGARHRERPGTAAAVAHAQR